MRNWLTGVLAGVAGVALASFLLPANRHVASAVRLHDPLARDRVPALVGRMLPDHALARLAGGTIHGAAPAGEERVLVFGGHPCAPCESVYDVLPTTSVQMSPVLVLLCADPAAEHEALGRFVSDRGFAIPVAAMAGGEADSLFGVTQIPLVLRVTKDGLVSDAVGGRDGARRAVEAWTTGG